MEDLPSVEFALKHWSLDSRSIHQIIRFTRNFWHNFYGNSEIRHGMQGKIRKCQIMRPRVPGKVGVPKYPFSPVLDRLLNSSLQYNDNLMPLSHEDIFRPIQQCRTMLNWLEDDSYFCCCSNSIFRRSGVLFRQPKVTWHFGCFVYFQTLMAGYEKPRSGPWSWTRSAAWHVISSVLLCPLA